MSSYEVTRAVGMWEASLTLNSNGTDSHFSRSAYVTSCLGEKKNTTVGVIAGGEAFSWNNSKNEWNPYSCRLLRVYFPRNWEFGSALSKLRNFGGRGVEPPPPSVCHWRRVYGSFRTLVTNYQIMQSLTEDSNVQNLLSSYSWHIKHVVKPICNRIQKTWVFMCVM
jgi:hypothetical protein